MSSPPPAKRARREFGLMRPDGSSFVGSASGIHFIQTVYNAISKAGAPNHVIPGEEDQLPQRSPDPSSWKPNELLPDEDATLELQTILQWSSSYFDNWHPAFSFLHGPTVVEWLSELCKGSLATVNTKLSRHQLTIVRSVMSISLADSRQSSQSLQLPPRLVFHSYDEAIKSLQPVLTDRPSIESLQAAMSIQLFLVSMLRLNAASRIHGIILRLLLQMGLHRCPKRYPNFSFAETDIRQRIFWSAYTIDKYLSQSLGLPITLRDDDCDVCFADQERHASDNYREYDMDDRLAFSCFVSKHAQLKGQVIELCNKSINHRQFETGPFQELSTKITKWTNEVEEYVQCSNSRSPSLSTVQRLTLNVLKHEIILSLHRPLLTAPKSSPDYCSAMQICIKESRLLILDLFLAVPTSHLASTRTQGSPADGLELISWPFLTWSIWISAFFVLFATAENEIMPRAALDLSDKSIHILKYLSRRGSPWPNACEAAIRDMFARFHQDTESSKRSRPIHATNAPGQTIDPAKAASVSNAKDGNATLGFQSDYIHPTLSQSQSSAPAYFDTMLSSASLAGQPDLTLFEGFDIPFWLDESLFADTLDVTY